MQHELTISQKIHQLLSSKPLVTHDELLPFLNKPSKSNLAQQIWILKDKGCIIEGSWDQGYRLKFTPSNLKLRVKRKALHPIMMQMLNQQKIVSTEKLLSLLRVPTFGNLRDHINALKKKHNIYGNQWLGYSLDKEAFNGLERLTWLEYKAYQALKGKLLDSRSLAQEVWGEKYWQDNFSPARSTQQVMFKLRSKGIPAYSRGRKWRIEESL